MNFYFDDVNREAVGYVTVSVHPKKLILNIGKGNILYKHSELYKLLDFITQEFGDQEIGNVEDFLLLNMRHMGIIVPMKPNQDNANQLSLF